MAQRLTEAIHAGYYELLIGGPSGERWAAAVRIVEPEWSECDAVVAENSAREL